MPKDSETDNQTARTTSETIEILHNRVSVRKYSDDPVSDEQVKAVLEAAFRAPTSSNIQAYSVVVVRDEAARQALSVTTGNQKHVAETPVFLAFCADLRRMEHALQRHCHDMDDNSLEIGLVSTIDASLVGMSAYLAADSLGLKGLMIGGVRNDPIEVARILKLPQRVYCVFGMCLGWPAEAPPQKPRMDTGLTVHQETYDPDGLKADLDAYDKDLAAHYDRLGKPTTPDSWTNDINKKFASPRRDALRQQLKERGFDFR